MTPITITVLTFIFGTLIGSFLSVCIYRIPVGKYEPVHGEGAIPLPAQDVSLLTPARSFCPHCQKQLHWWHNIPIVSWMLLNGKCGFCKTVVPFRYVFLELFTGCVAVLCFLRFGLNPTGIGVFVVLATMIVISFIDLDYMIIPDLISYPGTVLGLILAATNQFISPYIVTTPGTLIFHPPFVETLLDGVIGILAGAGLLYSVFWLYLKIRKKEGLGLGDVKLLAVFGAFFGFECAWFAIFVGSMLGSVLGILSALISRKGFSNYIPFGPYLVAGLMAFILDFAGIWSILSGNGIPQYWAVALR